jgi:hypothetical protein
VDGSGAYLATLNERCGKAKNRREDTKMANRIHSIKKTLRLTPKQAEALAAKAKEAGMCEADYLRLLLNQKPSDHSEIKELTKELINETRRVGNNINQIARNHNIGIYSPQDRNRLTAYMTKLYEAMERTVRAIGDN